MLQGMATVSFYAADLDAAARWYPRCSGIAPYFERPGYVEFRVGPHEDELGHHRRPLRSARTARRRRAARSSTGSSTTRRPRSTASSSSARPSYQPVTARGEGFVTAAVVDPFGNVLGVHDQPALGARA